LNDKNSIIQLYLLQIKNNGIAGDLFLKLNEKEKTFLERKEDKYYLKNEVRNKIKVVLTGGVFDIIHLGHIFTLSEAKKYGDVLIVSVARDEFINKKGRTPLHDQESRAKLIQSIKGVDFAIIGYIHPEELVSNVGPDVIVYGYDQKPFLKPEGVKIVKLEKGINEVELKTGKLIEKFGL